MEKVNPNGSVTVGLWDETCGMPIPIVDTEEEPKEKKPKKVKKNDSTR